MTVLQDVIVGTAVGLPVAVLYMVAEAWAHYRLGRRVPYDWARRGL